MLPSVTAVERILQENAHAVNCHDLDGKYLISLYIAASYNRVPVVSIITCATVSSRNQETTKKDRVLLIQRALMMLDVSFKMHNGIRT